MINAPSARSTNATASPNTGSCIPVDRSVTIYRLEAGAYGKPLVLGTDEACSPLAFPDLQIKIAEIFRDLPPVGVAA